MSDPLRFEKVSIDDAKKVLESGHGEQSKQEEQDWRWARTYSPPAVLKDATIAWLARLPENVRPRDLPATYPRITNKLCELWSNRDVALRYFDELASDKRGLGEHKERRRGFTGNVTQEIAALRKHFFNPEDASTAWENVNRRR